MLTTKLLLTAKLGDLARAASQAGEFAEWISANDGVDVSAWQSFLALLSVRPWASDFDARYPAASPWRVVRWNIYAR